MREEDLKRVYSAYKSCNMDIPYSKINDLISKSHTVIDTIGLEYCSYQRIPNMETEIKYLIKNIDSKLLKGRNWEEEYKLGLQQVSTVHSTMRKRTDDIMLNCKRFSFVLINQYRKYLTRQYPNTKMRRIFKEISLFSKRFDKERRDITKKMEKATQEKKKQIEENKEAIRQKRKFEYLLTQTELFSQFMLGKTKLDSFEKKGEVDEELAEMSKKFQMAASQIKAKEDEKKSEEEINQETVEEKIKLEQPKMLNCELKEYQITGFNWLAKLYNQGINGILADDMGLGKTVQSISLLAYLAESEDIWGPFLVVTPVSTLHNWEQELKKFLPKFKVLNYWGTSAYRTQARHEIKKVNVVLTSYQIAVADFKILRKITWKYMILDEAQAIKSSASKRWTTLLAFKTKSRLLLTGTPVQNTMSELWALLHFIMPTLFDSLSEFTEWFSKGIEESAEKKKAVDEIQLQKLHAILKPFMLRRLKSDVKTELGDKIELEVYCDLSVRQKIYYQSIIEACRSYEMENVVMQLRKVCNHPDIFEKLETTTKLSMLKYDEEGKTVELGRSKISLKIPSLVANDIKLTTEKKIQFAKKFNKLLRQNEFGQHNVLSLENDFIFDRKLDAGCIFDFSVKDIVTRKYHVEDVSLLHRKLINKIDRSIYDIRRIPVFTKNILSSTPYIFTNEGDYVDLKNENFWFTVDDVVNVPPLNTFIIDSGKLACLDKLLTKLKQEDHRVLLYFQMTKMMDLVENYCVKKEYTYCRLDGSSKISLRRDTVNDWQTGDKFIFLLSTRAGGLGINLTAADTVIFYDSDWNPTVDQQAMDRAYRIGQTKDVTVYRLITRNTIEERVIEKATNKGNLQKMVIKGKVFEGLDF